MRHDETHEDEQDETVGYGRPPKRTRFQKGRSGNPHGRPKGTLNLATVVARAIQEPVVISEHGRTKTIPKLEAVLKQLANKSVVGDLRASAQLIDLVQWTEGHQDGQESASVPLSDADQRVRDRILRKLAQQAKKGDVSHGTDADPE